MHEAIGLQRTQIVRVLIEAGVDVNGADEFGERPLHHLFSYFIFGAERHEESLEIVRLLIAAGADVNVRNNVGLTPLDWWIDYDIAGGNNDAFCVTIGQALECGGLRTEDGTSTLAHWAVACNSVSMLDYFYANGGDLEIRDYMGRTPLELEEWTRHDPFERPSAVLRRLLQLGAHVDNGPFHALLFVPLFLEEIKPTRSSDERSKAEQLGLSPVLPLHCLAAKQIVKRRLPIDHLPPNMQRMVHMHKRYVKTPMVEKKRKRVILGCIIL